MATTIIDYRDLDTTVSTHQFNNQFRDISHVNTNTNTTTNANHGNNLTTITQPDIITGSRSAYMLKAIYATEMAANNTSNYTANQHMNMNDTNSSVPMTSSPFDENDELLRIGIIFADVMQSYYMPIICGTGTIGNILSVFVFFKTKLRKLSSSFYLSALAVSDTCYLLALFVNWLNFLSIEIYNRPYYCEFFTFLSNLASFCSVWFVVAFTVERFIAVMYPLKRQTMCTVRRAKIVLIGLTLAGCMHCVPFLIISEVADTPRSDGPICDVKEEYKEELFLFNVWDTMIVFVVPFTTIAILNTYTGCTVWKFATVRRTLTMQKIRKTQSSSSMSIMSGGNIITAKTTANGIGNGVVTGMGLGSGSATTSSSSYRISSFKRQKAATTHPSGQYNVISRQHQSQQLQQQQQQEQQQQQQFQQINHHQEQQQAEQQQKEHQQKKHHCEIQPKTGRRKLANSSQLKVTKMLLIVSTVFVCFNLPSVSLRIKALWETQSSKINLHTVALQYIFQPLYVTNFGINFVLYCVSGQNFRKAVLSIFRRVSTAQREGITQVTVSEYCRNTGNSTRRRVMTQQCWNEMHELHPLK